MRTHHWFLILIVALCGILVFTTQHSALSNESVTLARSFVRGASVYVITVDLNDPGVRVDIGLPERGIHYSETFGSIVRRHAPLAAVTGTYFDMRTLLPTGTIVIDGKTVHQSHIGTAVCFTGDNKVTFVAANRGEPCDMSKAESGLRTGPRLLALGQYALNARREGYRHPGLFGARTRMALGVTPSNRLLLVSVRTPVTFSRLASIMKSLGAVDAVCLDGGTSSAMYFRGQILRRPGRMLTNVIEVRQRPVPVTVAKQDAVRGGSLAFQLSAGWRASPPIARSSRDQRGVKLEMVNEQAAVLSDSIRLRLAKGVHTLFPVDRA